MNKFDEINLTKFDEISINLLFLICVHQEKWNLSRLGTGNKQARNGPGAFFVCFKFIFIYRATDDLFYPGSLGIEIPTNSSCYVRS